MDPARLAELAEDQAFREELRAALSASDEGRRAIEYAVELALFADRQEPPAMDLGIGCRLRTPDALARWRRDPERRLLVIGDSIANQFSADLRRSLSMHLPGGSSFGSTGVAAGAFGGWAATEGWDDVGLSPENLGLPLAVGSAVRTRGHPGAALTWTRPIGFAADDAVLHWVDHAGAGPGFTVVVDDRPPVEVGCARPSTPTLQRTAVGPVRSSVEIRSGLGGDATPSPTFLGLDAWSSSAANVLHAATFPGGRIAGREGDDADACLRPDRLDLALEHIGEIAPTLVLWETINDARNLDLDRLDACIAAVAEAVPEAEHAAVAVYEVSAATAPFAAQDELHDYLMGRFDAVLDARERWGSPDDAVAAGLLGADRTHPTPDRGCIDLGRSVAAMLAVDG
jgi:hypothetical protein